MKIAIIGGGSTYSPELVHGLAERVEQLGVRTISLSDLDASRLAIVGGFVERMTKRLAPSMKIEVHRELDGALQGADFVVVQIRVGGQAARLEDEQLGLKHGVIGQETTGIGGLAKALRTIPALLHIAERTHALAPNALLINFTNPVSIVSEALFRHAPVRSIGLCNIPISQRMEIAAELKVDPDDVVIDSIGLNHLSFVRSVKVRGEEVLPKILKSDHGKPANLPDLDFPLEMIESLAMIPSGYLRYYFMQRETIAEQRAQTKLRAEEVMEIERELLAYYANPAHDEKPASLSKRGGAFYSRAALEIIEATAHNTGARLIVDVQNRDTIAGLPENACIETPCTVGAQAATPLPQKPLEAEIRGLIHHVKSYEELAVRAAISRSRRDLYLALLAHPLTQSAAVSSEIAESLTKRLAW